MPNPRPRLHLPEHHHALGYLADLSILTDERSSVPSPTSPLHPSHATADRSIPVSFLHSDLEIGLPNAIAALALLPDPAPWQRLPLFCPWAGSPSQFGPASSGPMGTMSFIFFIWI
jgi:hypothetical protein